MEPRRLSTEEVLHMAEIMSDSFMEHENWVDRIKKDKKRKQILRNLFAFMFKVINQYGTVFEIKRENQPIAYITYMDPLDEEQISFKRVLKTKGIKDVFKFIIHSNPSILNHMRNYMKVYNSHHIKTDKRYMHLYSTGILKEYRGNGIMGVSLRESFNYFFSSGIDAICLETSDLSNIPIYEKLGFEIEEIITKKNQTIYFFVLDKEETI